MKKKISRIWLPVTICLVLIANIAVFATNDTVTADIPLTVESMNYILFDAPTDIEYGIELINIGEMVVERSESFDARALMEEFSWGDNLFEVTSAEIWQNDIALSAEGIDKLYLDMAYSYEMTDMETRSLVQFNVTDIRVFQGLGNIPPQANVLTHIIFDVENNGMSGVHNPTVTLYSNGFSIGTLILTSFFPGNAEGTFTLTLQSGFSAGPHNIGVRVSGGNSNHLLVRPFTFHGGAARLDVASITRSALVPAITMRAQQYSVRITNTGTGRSVDNTPTDIHVNNQLLGRLNIPWLDPGDSVTFTFDLTFSMRGTYTVRAATPHNYRALITFIDFDTELWAGRWSAANARSLIVDASQAARGNFTIGQLEAYLAWNGITSNVHLSRLVNETYERHIRILTAFHPTNPNVAGWANVYRREGTQVVRITNVYTDPSTFVRGDTFIRPDLTGDLLRGVIIHEFGHLLGIGHTICMDLSVMTASPVSNFRTQVMPHDEHNLRMRYR